MVKKRRKRKKKLRIILFFLLIIIIGVIVFGIIYFENRKEKDNMEVILASNLEFDVNSEVYVNSLISNVVNGELISEDKLIDTSKIGTKKIDIKIKNEYDKERDYSFDILIVDKESPVVSCEKKIVINTSDEIDLLEYVSATDNYDSEFDILVDGTYDNNVNGEYALSYIVKDSSENEARCDFTLVVEKPKYRKMNDKTVTTSKGYTLKIKNGIAYIDGILIVNKTYYLPENYKPVNSYSKLSDNCANCLEKEVMEAYNEMKVDVTSLGLNIWLASGYRSYNTQKYLYNNYVSRDGVIAADTYSARAGHSEHQTGLAFDLNSVDSSFGYTNEGKWIKDNCYLYGFIIRYPEGKESITGYMYEPWHLRYVGKDLAKKLYNEGDWLTLEEYYGITSKYED